MQILVKNANFGQKFKFWSKLKFLSKIKNVGQKPDFRTKTWISTKIFIFGILIFTQILWPVGRGCIYSISLLTENCNDFDLLILRGKVYCNFIVMWLPVSVGEMKVNCIHLPAGQNTSGAWLLQLQLSTVSSHVKQRIASAYGGSKFFNV